MLWANIFIHFYEKGYFYNRIVWYNSVWKNERFQGQISLGKRKPTSVLEVVRCMHTHGELSKRWVAWTSHCKYLLLK